MSSPFDFLSKQNGTLYMDGLELKSIAEKVGTPAYVYSASALKNSLQALKSELFGLNFLVCFAMKANSNLSILRLLAASGAGADVVSGGELYRAKKAGISETKIVFSGVGKTDSEIEEALLFGSDGIFGFNVESVEELSAISSVALRLGKRARIALRFNPDVDPKTHPYISTGLRKNKFGMDRGEILALAKEISKFKNLSLNGISIHIGSQILSLAPLNEAFGILAKLALQVEKIQNHPLAYLDVGGGIGVSYSKERSLSLKKYGELLRKHFGEKSALRGRYQILLEPGRLISANSGVLLTRVLFRKRRKQKDFLIVDAGMNDLIRPSLYGSHHEIVPLSLSRLSGSKRKADVVGPVCESADCFASGRVLSANIERGDLLAILSAGAYGFTMSSQYNSRPRPPEILLNQGKLEVVRERETYEDLMRGEKA